MKRKHRMFMTLLLAVLLCFAACGNGAGKETVPPTEDPALQVLEYTLAAQDPSELAALDVYPNLKRLDLRGSSCYDAIMEYIAAHPQVEVVYDVRLGDQVFAADVRSMTFGAGDCSHEELIDKLVYFPGLETLRLNDTDFSAQELAALRERYPNLALDYTLTLLGEEISWDTAQLDLSALTPEQMPEAAEALAMLPQLRDVYLMNDEDRSALGLDDVKVLMDVASNADIHYSFDLFGQRLSTDAERVEYDRVRIGDEGVAQVRQALDILPKCTYFLLDGCGISNEVMAQLRADYPDTKVVWRISYAGRHTLTDTEVIHCVGDLYDYNLGGLKYCTDVVYLDAGHCYNLSDLSFVSGMTKLKVAIVVDCYASTLEPFATCSSLEYLEIVNCNRITDLSPLANCKNLKGLNMSYTFSIDDLTPLYGLENMERLFLGRNDVPQEQVDAVREALPDCWVTDKSESVAWVGFNYSVGWRLDDEHTFAEWYKEIKEVFGYKREIY